jgi:molybdopterin-synthase adenylyltransferase
MNEIAGRRLRAVPADVVKVDDGAILRRDCTILRVHGHGAEEILRVLLALASEGGATRPQLAAELTARFPGIGAAVDNLLASLVECRILVDEAEHSSGGSETPTEIFFWNYDAAWEKAASSLSEQYVLLLGVNALTRSLGRALVDCGTDTYDIADYASLRDPRLFSSDGTFLAEHWPPELKRPLDSQAMDDIDMGAVACLVAATDIGAQHVLRPLNDYALRNNIPFLPVVLHDHVGHIGPLVIPGETACLECLRARQNANLDDPTTYRAAEMSSASGARVVGYHPAMVNMIANVVVMELTKLFCPRLPHRNVGMLIDVKLLDPSITRRKVLKVPRCRACGTTNAISAANTDKREYVPDPAPAN